MTPEKLIEEMARKHVEFAPVSSAHSMLRRVLKAIEDGDICYCCGENGCEGAKVKPEYQKFLKEE